jgi:hypothetical protein
MPLVSKKLNSKISKNTIKKQNKKYYKIDNKSLQSSKKENKIRILKKKHIKQVKKSRTFKKNIYRRFRRLYKNEIKFINKNYFALTHSKYFRAKINIKIKANNIFCSLLDNKLSKTLKTASSGMYAIKISKKKLNNNFTVVLKNFMLAAKKKIKNKKRNVIVNIIAPTRIRKKIVKYVFKKLRFINKKIALSLIFLKEKKCFNGCKPRKQQKKKRKYFRIFK